MKKIILVILISMMSVSCYYYPYSYQSPVVVRKPAAVAPPVRQTVTQQRSVLVSYDGGRTYVEKIVTIVTESPRQHELVQNYWRQHPTPQWIASPTRAWLDTGGLFGQYLFQDVGIRFLVDSRRISLLPRR